MPSPGPKMGGDGTGGGGGAGGGGWSSFKTHTFTTLSFLGAGGDDRVGRQGVGVRGADLNIR